MAGLTSLRKAQSATALLLLLLGCAADHGPDIVLTPESKGTQCAGNSSCEWAEKWKMEGKRWNGTALLYAPRSRPKSLADCCAACTDTPACVLFDYDAGEGRCQLYNASPYFNPSGLVDVDGSEASFLDWKALSGHEWDGVAGLLPVAGDALDASNPSSCATTCSDTCDCILWQADVYSPGTPCILYTGGDEPVEQLQPAAFSIPPSGVGEGEPAVAGFMVGHRFGTTVQSAEFDWRAATQTDTFRIDDIPLADTMPSLEAGGNFTELATWGWYAWDTDTELNNPGRRIRVDVENMENWPGLVDTSITNTSLEALVLPLVSGDAGSSSIFRATLALQLDEEIEVPLGAQVRYDVEYVTLEVPFTITLLLFAEDEDQCTESTDGSGSGSAGGDEDVSEDISDLCNGPAATPDLQQLCEDVLERPRRRALLQDNDLLDDLLGIVDDSNGGDADGGSGSPGVPSPAPAVDEGDGGGPAVAPARPDGDGGSGAAPTPAPVESGAEGDEDESAAPAPGPAPGEEEEEEEEEEEAARLPPAPAPRVEQGDGEGDDANAETASLAAFQQLLRSLVLLERLAQREGMCGTLVPGSTRWGGNMQLSGRLRITLPTRIMDTDDTEASQGGCPVPDPCAQQPARTFNERRWFREDARLDAFRVAEPLKLPTNAVPDTVSCCRECAKHESCVFFEYHATENMCHMYETGAVALKGGDDASGALAYAPDFRASFLGSKQFSDMVWEGDAQWNAWLSNNLPGRWYNEDRRADVCSAMCAAQCGCSYWSLVTATAECRMFPQFLLSSSGLAVLRRADGTTSGLRFGAALVFQFSSSNVEWETRELSGEYEEEAQLTLLNKRGSDSSTDALLLPFDYNWTLDSAVFIGLLERAAALPLDGLLGALGNAADAVRNSSLTLTGSLDSIPFKPDSAGLQLAVERAIELPARSRSDVRVTTTKVNVTAPFSLTVTASECLISDVEGGVMKRSNSTRLGERLSLDVLLRQGGFCPSAGSSVDYGTGGAATATRGSVRVKGDLALQGLPIAVQVQAVDTVDTAAGDAGDLLVGHVLEGTDLPGTNGLCTYSNGWEECAELCAQQAACVGWSYSEEADPERTGCRAGACQLKARVQLPASPRNGYVSSLMQRSADEESVESECSLLPDALVSTEFSTPLQASQLSSASQCCAQCRATESCTAFAFDLAGLCTLMSGNAVAAAPSRGTTSGIVRSDQGCPRVAFVPAGRSVAAALEAVPGSRPSWEAACCANGLEQCGEQPRSVVLLLPCSSEALPDSCAASRAVKALAVAANNCSCSGDYTAVFEGRRVRMSGGCMPGGKDDLEGPWCNVDAGSCDASGLPSDSEGRYAACQLADVRLAADGAPALGCNLLDGVALRGAGGPMNDGRDGELGSVSDCCSLCVATTRCAGFTYFQNQASTGGACWLYSEVAATQPAEDAISGINRGARQPAATARRRRLQEGGSCPSVLTLGPDEALDSLSAADLNGATWQQVCCFNGLSSCGQQQGAITLMLPCASQTVGDCAAANDNTIYVYEGEDQTLAITLGIALGCGLGLLVGGALAAFLYSASKGKTRMRKAVAAGGEGGAGDPLLLADGGTKGQLALGNSVTGSPAFKDGKYMLGAEGAARTDNGVVVLGAGALAAQHGVAAKFFSEPAEYRREAAFYDSKVAYGHVPEVYSLYPPPATSLDAGAAPWPCIVMERGDYTLAQWLAKAPSRRGRGGDAVRRAALRDTVEGLAALHANNIVHRDVKPSNVMWFGEAHSWKLIDFATWATAGQPAVPQYTLRYAAPELLTAALRGGKAEPQPAADMWSLGCIAWELYFGEPLFGEEYSDSEVKGMLMGDLPLPFQKYRALWSVVQDEAVRPLLQRLLSQEPSDRPNCAEVLASGVFRTGADTVMQRELVAAANKDVERVQSQVKELTEVSMEVVRASAAQSLVVFLDLQELMGDDGTTPAHLEQAGGGKGWDDKDDEDEYYSGDELSLAGGAPPSDGGSFKSSRSFSFGLRSFTSVRSGISSVGRSRGRPPALGSTTVRPADGSATWPSEYARKKVYNAYATGELVAIDAPLGLATSTARSGPEVQLHAEACYAVRFKVCYGGEQLGEVPITDIKEVTIADASGWMEPITLPVAPLPEACDVHGWEGFAIWTTAGVKPAKLDLQLSMHAQLTTGDVPITMTKSLRAALQAPGTNLTPARLCSQLAEQWANAPDWLKLTARGVYAWYGLG